MAKRMMLMAGLCVTVMASISHHPAWASEAVLALEREELSQGCTEIEFLDGFLTQVDANGDEFPDYLTNTQHFMCDGSQSMWCGTLGCVHRIWMQKPDGGFEAAFDSYAYEVVFDRPGQTSFRVATRDGETRKDLATKTGADDSSVGAGASGSLDAPADRWIYSEGPSPAAAIGPAHAQLSFTCEEGAFRLRYSGWWLYDGDEINQGTREWDESDYGIVPSFDISGHETDVPVRLSEAERMLVAKDMLPVTSPLIDALSRGNFVTVHHGGSIEHELNYPLSGSAAALASLRKACS